MTKVEFDPIQTAVNQVEASLKTLEDYLENNHNRELHLVTTRLVEALHHFHNVNTTYLNPENRNRIETLLHSRKLKTGRDSFNTGF